MPKKAINASKLKEIFVKHRIFFEKPINYVILLYLARMRWCSHRKSPARTLKEIKAAVSTLADSNIGEVAQSDLSALALAGLIVRINPHKEEEPKYEITKDGNDLAIYFKRKSIPNSLMS